MTKRKNNLRQQESPLVRLANVEKILVSHSSFYLVFPLVVGAAQGYCEAKNASEKFSGLQIGKALYDILITKRVLSDKDPLIEEAYSALKSAYPAFFNEMEKEVKK